MGVCLRHSGELPVAGSYDRWFSIDGRTENLDADRKLPNLPSVLERAFDAIAGDWLFLGHALSAAPSSGLAHATACTTNVSDLGVMMAWSHIVGQLAEQGQTTLAICDDPWLYRQLAGLDGVEAGARPPIRLRQARLFLRGLVARTLCAARLARAHFGVRSHRQRAETGRTVMLVYGHPRSTAEGEDGYFSDLLCRLPDMTRMLHVDCPAPRARQLQGRDRTRSLHAWGRLSDIPALPFARWRPQPQHTGGRWGWLVRRAAAMEGGTGQAAMIRWQQKCQARWLQEYRPKCVIWPWENHNWERDFVRAARAAGVHTIGYQHSVVGRQMLNYAPASNRDGLHSLPDTILCTGPATQKQLALWGIPEERLKNGGALRIPEISRLTVDPDGPVYLALSFDAETARQMIAAADQLTHSGYRFVVKNHPMQPVIVPDNPHIAVTDKFFFQHDNLQALIFASTTVGLEAALAGLPTIRFQTEGRLALDILPQDVSLPAADATGLAAELDRIRPPRLDRSLIFSPVDFEFWKRTLGCD